MTQVAQLLAKILVKSDVIALWGEVGVGKSAFARIITGTRWGGGREFPSPTFSLSCTYFPTIDIDCKCYHFDFYHCSSRDYFPVVDLKGAFDRGVSLIEWPQYGDVYLPLERLDVFLSFGHTRDTRYIRLAGNEKWKIRVDDVFGNGQALVSP